MQERMQVKKKKAVTEEMEREESEERRGLEIGRTGRMGRERL